MTPIGTNLTALFAALAAGTGGVLGGSSGDDPPTPGTALVIDAAAARDGRELVDHRLGEVDAEVRLPRTAAEARTDVRYFAAQGYDLVVAGPQARQAARATGATAERAAGLTGALEAAAR